MVAVFTLAIPAAPFSLSSWVMSTLCSAGFFLTGPGVDGPGEEGTEAVIFTFFGAGDEEGGGRRGAGGQDEKEGLVEEGLAMTRPVNRPGTGTGLGGVESPLGGVRLWLLTRRDRKLDCRGRELIMFFRFGLEVGQGDLEVGKEVLEIGKKEGLEVSLRGFSG
jgi:hypothetical protein